MDKLVNKTILLLFARFRAVPEQEMEQARHEQALQIGEKTYRHADCFRNKEKELESYKVEIYQAIQGKSSLDKEILNELILDAKKQLEKVGQRLKQAGDALEAEKSHSAEVKKQAGRLLQWTELYSSATFDA